MCTRPPRPNLRRRQPRMPGATEHQKGVRMTDRKNQIKCPQLQLEYWDARLAQWTSGRHPVNPALEDHSVSPGTPASWNEHTTRLTVELAALKEMARHLRPTVPSWHGMLGNLEPAVISGTDILVSFYSCGGFGFCHLRGAGC